MNSYKLNKNILFIQQLCFNAVNKYIKENENNKIELLYTLNIKESDHIKKYLIDNQLYFSYVKSNYLGYYHIYMIRIGNDKFYCVILKVNNQDNLEIYNVYEAI